MTDRKPAALFSFLLLALLLLSGIPYAAQAMPPFDAKTVPAAPDYAQAESWLALPDTPGAYPVDVFWIYPTVPARRFPLAHGNHRPRCPQARATHAQTTGQRLFWSGESLRAPVPADEHGRPGPAQRKTGRHAAIRQRGCLARIRILSQST